MQSRRTDEALSTSAPVVVRVRCWWRRSGATFWSITGIIGLERERVNNGGGRGGGVVGLQRHHDFETLLFVCF